MTNMATVEKKFEALKTAVENLGDIKDIIALKGSVTPELRAITTACKALPVAQKLAVLATLNSDDKKTVELLIKAPDMPQDAYNQMRHAYFALIDELESFRKENGKFKRPFTRGKKTKVDEAAN